MPENTDTPRGHQRGGSGEIVCRDKLLDAPRHAVLPVDSPQALVSGARRDVYVVKRRHALPAGAPIPVAGELLHEPRRLALLGWGRDAVEPEAILKPSLFRKLLLGMLQPPVPAGLDAAVGALVLGRRARALELGLAEEPSGVLARAGAGRRVQPLQRVGVVVVHVGVEDEPPRVGHLVVAGDPPVEEPHPVRLRWGEVYARRQRRRLLDFVQPTWYGRRRHGHGAAGSGSGVSGGGS